jgi:GNAT superfamily N-acetyltransferase
MGGDVTIRVAQTFEDALAAVGLRDRCFPPQVTPAESVRRGLERDPESYHVLAERDGQVVGSGECFRLTGVAIPGLLVGGAYVLREERCHGLGDRLLRLAADRALEREAQVFGGMLRGDDAESVSWLEHRGFREYDRIRRAALDVASCTAGPPSPPDGVTLLTLADRPDLERAMYEVECDARVDIPSNAPMAAQSYEDWRAGTIERPGVTPDSIFLAVAGDEVAGFATLAKEVGRPGVGLHVMTGVARSWRGKGVAGAIKRWQVEWAREHGITTLETDNNDLNLPMRAVNAALGYRPLPDMVTMGAELPLAPR